jgi:hypothetical protein
VPGDLLKDLDDATWSKIGFNYTGPDPLDGPEMSEKIPRMLKKAKQAFPYLPVLLSYGHSCVLQEVTNDWIGGWTVQVFCQVIINYLIQVWKVCSGFLGTARRPKES